MAPGISSCHYPESPHAISFSGSGFLATYQLGVAQCFLNYAPWILSTAPCVLGASAGSLVAAAVVCEMRPVTIWEEVLKFARLTMSLTLGPFNPSINVSKWLESVLIKYLPSDAHLSANGRLAVAMTRMTDSKLTIMMDFSSKEDVVQALLCSCFVPGYCGLLPPTFKGVYYVDGGFRSMQPLPVSKGPILTVSPFSGVADICPSDAPAMWDMVVSGTSLKGNMANSFRILNALYPFSLETLEEAFPSGYKDAFNFLINNNLAKDLILSQVSLTEPLNYNLNKEEQNLKDNMDGEGELKERKKTNTLTNNVENGHVKGSLTDTELTCNLPKKEPTLRFDVVKNVLLSNMVTYMSMFGLPARILSHLFLPLMVSFYAVLQSRKRVEQFFRMAPQYLVWIWYTLRHFSVFFYEIVVFSLKKYFRDRIMPTLLLLQWLKIHRRFEGPSLKKHPLLSRMFPASAHSNGAKRGPVK